MGARAWRFSCPWGSIPLMDTSSDMAERVARHHARLTPEERWRVASQMFETARAIIESSLPAGLTPAERRVAVLRRLYGTELPPAAFQAVADFAGAR